MLTAAVFVGLLAFVSANGHNMMGGMFGQGMMGQNMGWNNNNNMGWNNNNMGWNNMGMGNMQGNMQGNQMNGLSQLLQLLGGRQGMGGQMGGGQTGGGQGMNNQGVMGGMMMLILQNLLQNNGNRGNRDNDMDREEMEGLEEMMKHKMMMEMADMIAMQMNFKEKEKEFSESMEAMCFMVNATYEAFKRNGTEVWQETDDAMMMQLGSDLEKMSKSETMEFAINMFNNNMQRYNEIFLRFATWACMTGDAYVEAYMKMEKMNRGEGECH